MDFVYVILLLMVSLWFDLTGGYMLLSVIWRVSFNINSKTEKEDKRLFKTGIVAIFLLVIGFIIKGIAIYLFKSTF